ncbi:plasmid pRiA4b ORF-3 family protein [Thermodesulfobacteriota bacterium B35]
MAERHYLLAIRLTGIKPEIRRRFVVPADITLDRLHDVIQIVMGWTDNHPHQFTIGNKQYTEYPEDREDGLPCGRYRLVDLIRQKGRTFSYLYDYGDFWEHELTIEDSRYPLPEADVGIICLDGARACPPEDVGGVAMYEEFCRVIRDPGHEKNKSSREWAGWDFDSEKFDVNGVNRELMKYLRWSRDRYQQWRATD